MELCQGSSELPEKYLHLPRGRMGHVRSNTGIVGKRRGLSTQPFGEQEGVLVQIVIFIGSLLLGAVTKH